MSMRLRSRRVAFAEIFAEDGQSASDSCRRISSIHGLGLVSGPPDVRERRAQEMSSAIRGPFRTAETKLGPAIFAKRVSVCFHGDQLGFSLCRALKAAALTLFTRPTRCVISVPG